MYWASNYFILFLEAISLNYAYSNKYLIYTSEIFRLLIDFSTNRRQMIHHDRSYHELLSNLIAGRSRQRIANKERDIWIMNHACWHEGYR